MSKITQALSANIKKIRQNKGISQDKLSKLAGVTLHTITKIETKATLDPRIVTIKKIADALDSSIDRLLK
jgi:transcriptional regulator with XRE-family HTH domain